MADRKAKTSGVSEDPKEVVELDKDERWQARLEEARARREVALREKAASPKKKQRRKPWEEEPGDDPDDFEIKPVIQDKPADEKALDFADRMENARVAKAEASTPAPVPEPDPEPKPTPEPEAKPDPVPAPPPPKAKPRVVPEFKARARNFDEIIPPTATPPTVAPAPLPKRNKRRNADLVAAGAPDVIDLAQRYASTLKPPHNVTQPFDTVPREAVSTPPPEAMVYTGEKKRSRRPFGLGLIVLIFSLVPLSQVAPPLEKGPAQPANPFFGLPPALGLTTSMVWPVEQTQSGEWVPAAPPAALGGLPAFEVSPFNGGLGDLGVPAMPGAVPGDDPAAPLTILEGNAPALSPPLGTLSTAPAPDAPAERLEVPVPRARPTAPEPEVAPVDDAASRLQNDTVVERATGRSEPDLAETIAPDARPRPAPAQVRQADVPLRVTILVPSAANAAEAEAIAADAQARGHELARIREVDLSISRPNVRYFHAEDRAEAARLAQAYGAEVKDFTWFRPAPEKGTTEIWLSGSGNPAPARPAPAARTVEDAPQAPPRTITVIRKQPTLLERWLTGAEDEIEIILPDPAAILEDAQAGTFDQN